MAALNVGRQVTMRPITRRSLWEVLRFDPPVAFAPPILKWASVAVGPGPYLMMHSQCKFYVGAIGGSGLTLWSTVVFPKAR